MSVLVLVLPIVTGSGLALAGFVVCSAIRQRRESRKIA